MQAREAFGLRGSVFTEGQVYPRRLGLLLVDRGRSVDAHRQLEFVRVYRGEPSAKHDQRGQAACQRQVRYWKSQNLVEPWTRPLRYYPLGTDAAGNTIYDSEEKGIEVRLAVDMVMGAERNEYDVAILCTCDTDLTPAHDAVFALGKHCEVAAWKSPTAWSPRLHADSRSVWCHWLDPTDYQRVHDPSDYTRPLPAPPAANP